MRSCAGTIALFTVLIAVTAGERMCRSGINTTILGFPLRFWDESSRCSTSSSQSCFIGEIGFDVNFQEDNLTMVYGSCISTVYKSLLKCDTVFPTSSVSNIQLLNAFLPDFQGVVEKGIKTLSEDTARKMKDFLKNENGELDNLRILQEVVTAILTNANQSIPSNTASVLEKLDTLLLTALFNISDVGRASTEFLESFENLNTNDIAASKLLNEFFERNNISVPSEFIHLIDYIPGLISQYIENETIYEAFNQSMFLAISRIGGSNVTAATSALTEVIRFVVADVIHADFNIAPILDAVSRMIIQLSEGKLISELSIWELDLLTSYSQNSSVTENFSTSLITLISNMVPEQKLSQRWITLINSVPGFLYRFSNDDRQLDEAFESITTYLDLYQTVGLNLSSNLRPWHPNASTINVQDYIQFAMSMINASTNLTALLPEGVRLRNSTAFGNLLIDLLAKYHITVPAEYHHAIHNIPGLLLTLVSHQDNMSNSTMFDEILSQMHSGNLTLEATFLALSEVIPPSFNLRQLVVSLPQLITHLADGNFTYINKWQMDLFIAYSRVTEATQAFSNAILEYLKMGNVISDVPEDLKTLIQYYPGYLYNFFPPEIIPQFEQALHNISEILRFGIDGNSVSLGGLLQSYSIDTSDPVLQGVIRAVDSILNLSRARNLTSLGLEALIALDKVSVVTNRTTSLVTSFRQFLLAFNITVPSEYGVTLDYTPGLILTLFPGQEEYINMIFSNVSAYISSFNSSEPNFDAIFEVMTTMIPQEYNLNKFLRSLSPLITQLMNGNIEYVNEWQARVFVDYANITSATETFTNATFGLFQRVGLYNYLPSDIILLIRYYPGYMYQFIPPSLVQQYELALHQTAEILSISESGNQVDVGSILESYSLNISDPGLQIAVNTFQRILNVATSRNLTELGFQALTSLKQSSVITNETAALSASFLGFLETFNISLPTEYQEIIQNVPGLVITLFPQYEEILKSIFSNSSSVLTEFDLNNYDTIFVTLRSLIPTEYNLDILIDSLPPLLEQLSVQNYTYMNTWQLDLLKKYGKVTPATESLRNSTLDFISRIGYGMYISPDLHMLITYIPGYLYTVLPDATWQIDLELYNISNMLHLSDSSSTISTSDVLQSFSLNISDPSVMAVTTAIDSILNIAHARNISELGEQALMSLQNVSVNTTESKLLSDSFSQFLEQFNISIPDNYQDVLQSSVGLLITIMPQQGETIRNLFLNVSRFLNGSGTGYANFEVAVEFLKSFTPVEYNLHVFMDSLPALISQLSLGNFTYVNQWQSSVLQSYSIITPATESFVNSTIGLLTRAGLYDYMTEDQKSLISAYPGYIYYFVPADMRLQFESVLLNISEIFKITNPGQSIDIEGSFDSWSLNRSDSRVQIGLSLIKSITNLASATNITEFAVQALESLKDIAIVNNETQLLSSSILKVVQQFNETVPDGYQDVIQNGIGLFYGLFPEQKDLLNGIFLNISAEFATFNPDNLTFSSLSIFSAFVPGEYNLQPFIDSLPSLLQELTKENYDYINVWQINLVRSYSRLTNATDLLSSSINLLIDRYGLRGDVSSEFSMLIQYYPGFLYNIVPSDLKPQLDLAFSSIAAILNATNPDVDTDIFGMLLDQFSFNSSNIGLPESISKLNSILNIARSRNLTDLAAEALTSLKMVTTITVETSNLTDSLIKLLESVNVTIPPEYQEMMQSIPGLLLITMPDERHLISEGFANVSQILYSLGKDPPDIRPAIKLLQEQVPVEYNLNKLLDSMESLFHELILGNFEHIYVWQVNLLANYSRITPATTEIANSVIQLLQRWSVYDSLPQEVKTLIEYYPGYLYNFMTPTVISQYDLLLQNATQILHLTDPNKNITIQEIFQSYSFNASAPGISEIVSLLTSISNLTVARNLSDFGIQALDSLKNVVKVTEETQALSDSVIRFLNNLNISVPDEYQKILLYAPGMLVSGMPQHGDLINDIFRNISYNLDHTNTMSPNFTMIFGNLMQIVPDEYNLDMLIQSIPALLDQMLQGNFNYVNAWQLNVLKSYSKITHATDLVYNSTVKLIERLRLNVTIPEEIDTFIKYYPGYFYNFIGNDTVVLEKVLHSLSMSMDMFFPSQTVAIQYLLNSLDVNVPTAEVTTLTSGLNSLVNIAMSRNLTEFRMRLAESLKSFSRVTNTSQSLSSSVLEFFDQMNVTYTEEYRKLTLYIPSLFLSVLPEHTDEINSVFMAIASTVNSFNSSLMTNPDAMIMNVTIQRLFEDIWNQLEANNISAPSEVLGFVSLLQKYMAAISVQQRDADWWINQLSLLIGNDSSNSSTLLVSVINSLVFRTDDLSNTTIVDTALHYLNHLPRIYLSLLNNQSLGNVVFEAISERQHGVNLGGTEFLLNMTKELLPGLPPALHHLIINFGNLLHALVTNNQSAINAWGNNTYHQYCSSERPSVVDFANVLTSQLQMSGWTAPEYMIQIFRCVPEMLYTFMPNQTEILDDSFRLSVLASTNYSAYIKELLKMTGVDLPTELIPILNTLPDFQSALTTWNLTELTAVLSKFQSTMSQETKLSNLTMKLISKIGLSITDETKSVIRQVTDNGFFPMLSKLYPSIDTFLSAAISNLDDGTDVGTSFVKAFASVNVTVSDRYIPLFNHFGSLVDAISNNSMDIMNKAVLDILISYNASFPSYQIQYAIHQFQLQMLLQHLNSTDIPEAAFVHLGSMYELFLKMSNLSENILKNAIVNAYPDAKAPVDVMLQLEPKDSLRFIYNVTIWIFSSSRNITVLAEHITTIIGIIFEKENLQFSEILIMLTKPIASSCKYETCETDLCNTYDLLAPVVTTTTVSSSSAGTTSTMTASTLEATTTAMPTTAQFSTTPTIHDSTSTEIQTTAEISSDQSSTLLDATPLPTTLASNTTTLQATVSTPDSVTSRTSATGSSSTSIATGLANTNVSNATIASQPVTESTAENSVTTTTVPVTTETTSSDGQSSISSNEIHLNIMLLGVFLSLNHLFL